MEIGAGFAAAAFSGEENADEMRMGNDGRPLFLSNNAGGVLGGISTASRWSCASPSSRRRRSSIRAASVNQAGEEIDIFTKGRHDPCVGIRAVPIGEAMLAIVLADQYLRHRAQVG